MKKERHLQILSIVERQVIRTQEELLQALEKEGVHTTQATLSRDMKEMNLQKKPGSDGISRYLGPDREEQSEEINLSRYRQVLRHVLLSAVPAENLAVVKTLSGTANAAAAALETMSLFRLIGTLAGDDTLLCVFADSASAQSFCHMLNSEFIGEGI